jgi:hypothetical protein
MGMLASRPWVEDTTLGVGVWLTDPPGGVARIVRAREIDVAIADYFLNDAVRAFHVAGPPPWVIVLDWSRATGYTSAARAQLTSWCLDNRDKVACAVIVLPETAPQLLKMGVSVGGAMLRAAGVELHVAPGLTEAMLVAKVRERA